MLSTSHPFDNEKKEGVCVNRHRRDTKENGYNMVWNETRREEYKKKGEEFEYDCHMGRAVLATRNEMDAGASVIDVDDSDFNAYYVEGRDQMKSFRNDWDWNFYDMADET